MLCFIVLFVFVLCLVPNVASVSGLSSLDCPSIFSDVCLYNISSALTWFIRYVYYSKLQFLYNTIINKTKVSSGIGDHNRFWRSCLGPWVSLLPKLEIIWLSNLSIFGVPEEGYSRNVSCTLNLISTFLFLRLYRLLI